MKKLNLAFVLILIWIKSFSQEQTPTITVSLFENDEIKNFNTINDVTQKITNELIRNSFKIEVLKSLGIEKIQQVNGTSNFYDLPLDSSSTLYNYYTSIPGMVSKNGKLDIKLIKRNEERILTLIVKAITIDQSIKEVIPDCIPIKEYNNNFGEEPSYYDENKIVYVYDFNKDPSKREFYKIIKDHDTLKRKLVNFNKETLTQRKNVKFKIYNINKFMYDVSIADSVFHFDSEPSALLYNFFLGDTTKLLGSLMGTFSNNITPHYFNESAAKDLIDTINKFITDYNKLRAIALNTLNPCNKFECCKSFDYDYYLNTLIKIKSQSKNVERKLNELKNDPSKAKCNEQFKLKKQAEINIKNLNYEISKFDLLIQELILENISLTNNIEKIKGEINEIESQVFFAKGADSLTKRVQLLRLETELSSKKSELTSNRIELTKFQKDRNNIDSKAYETLTSIDLINDNTSQLCNENIQELIEALEISNSLIDNLPKEDEIKRLVVLVNNMIVENNSYTSDYISLNGNMLDLTINIASKDSTFKYFSIPEYKNDPLQIQIPILRKPFVSFSSGSFMAIGKHLQNKTYDWQGTIGNNNIISDLNFTLVESGYTIPPMGFCGLGNLEWKITRSFGLGGSAGVGLTIEKTPRMAYLGGGSLFFGDLRQFTITGGFVGMQIDKLTNNFQNVADNQVIYTSKPDIKYYKEFKVGGFVSLTYTPFKVYKTKTIKSKNK